MVHRVEGAERQEILARLSAAMESREDLAFAYVYGSFLHEGGFRDIDVAMWVTPHASPRLDVELASHFTRLTGIPVDVRVLNGAPISFVFHALRGRPLVVKDEQLLSDLIERTARAYHDRAPLIRRSTREAFAA